MPYQIDYPIRLYATLAHYLFRRGTGDAVTCGKMARGMIHDRRNGGKFLRRMAGDVIRRAIQSRHV